MASAELRRERKFRIALLLYAVLAALVWFTLGEGHVLILGRAVEIRVLPIFVIGTLVFRTFMARWADQIRQAQAEKAGNNPPDARG